ncbi:MAG: rod shape-determining protein MreD [Treponema sp.]|nr:rod shape-determining protein MreD [Candidatus Treponema merdequi]
MTKSYLSGFLFLIIFVLIETAILSKIAILPAMPDLMLLCSLYLAVNNGSVQGQITGFTSGLLIDFLSGSPFGLNCLIRTIIGYIAGFLRKMLNLKSFFVTFLIGFSGTVLKALLICIASFFFPNMMNTYNVFSKLFLFELFINSLLCPLMFKFLDCFSGFLILPYNYSK